MGKIFDALEKHKTEEKTRQSTFVPNAHKTEKKAIGLQSSPPVALQDRVAKKAMVDRNMVVLNDPMSQAAEQFKILRARLLFPQHASPPRIIMVTSAFQADGKSFTAANLAVSIAQGINDYVLLIDCDMRRPVQHQMFGFGRVEGLSDHLAGNRKLEEVLLKTSVDKLTLLPGGTIPSNPSELLSSKKMASLLAEVRERYGDRYIIIDSPPPHLTAESNALAHQVDGILLVVKHLQTPKAPIEALVEKIGKEKIIGVLLNRFSNPLKNYGNYQTYKASEA